MKHPVRLERNNGVAVILIENPPVNALSAAVRRGILGALGAALSDDTIGAVVLAAKGNSFSAGADITEFGKPAQEPSLPELCNLIEGSPKPVIAALQGVVLGGGLELAMSAHYRVAHHDCTLGLPEIKLGLLPGAGGTQRAPRLVGVDLALDMMLSGTPITAEQALRSGLVDGLADDDLRDVVKALASETDQPRPTRAERRHFADGASYMARIAQRRAGIRRKALAENKIVDCVEAALLVPFDAGLEMEREAFMDCLASPVSAALRYSFAAERRATKFPELKEAGPRPVNSGPLPVNSVGVLGGGMMGSGIAIACLDAGLPVKVVELDEGGVTRTLDTIGAHYQRGVSTGRITEAQGAAALTHLTLTTAIKELNTPDIVIEALPEDITLKQEMFRQLGGIAKYGAVLASNTSYQDITTLQQASGRPQDVLAMHFFAPAHRMKLVEIGVSAQTDPQAVVSVHALAKMLGKMPVRSRAVPGFIGNQLLSAGRRAADRLLLDGATPAQVDGAMRSFGMAMGPYQALDMSGLDISWARRRAAAQDPDPRYLALADRMCEQGWFGQKAGRGYYVYADGERHGVPNPEMLQLLADERRAKGITARSFSDRQMRDHLLLTWVNEGARLVGEGVATRPSDIDAVMVHGFGYPRGRGGPMLDADQTTPFQILRRIEILHKEDPSLWDIAPLLRELAAERGIFSELNHD